MNTRAEAERILTHIATAAEEDIDLAEGALALAALDRPRVGLERYREHLAALAADVAAHGVGEGDDIEDCIAALNDTLFETHGYDGDHMTYDDLQNANLMRVIDRRKGLPVALGILYLHAGRAQGWRMSGLAFPSHFMVRLEVAGERAILDPFARGARYGPGDLRAKLKAIAGASTELRPEHYAPVGDRDVLLRLQNNIKLRRLQAGDTARAIETVDSMLALAPGAAGLWWEAGELNQRQGNLMAAATAFERFIAESESESARHRAAALVQALRARIN
jgi:regulator of sirC expression with transglutaminase-like and TPR domain